MGKKFKKVSLLAICLTILWIFIAQGCMTFRMSDNEAKKEFTKIKETFITGNIKVGNRNVHYAAIGSDTLPALLFVHGSPGSWDAFKIYMLDSALRSNYRMISIDRPGFGYSDFGKAVNLQEQVSILVPAILKLVGQKKVTLVGHSLGAPVILKLAAEGSLSISQLVLIAGSVSPAEEAPEKWRTFLEYSLLSYMLPGAFRPSNTEIVYFKKDVYSLPADFPKIHSPVLIFHGDKDDFVPPGNAVFAQQSLINAQVRMIWFEGERHFIPWTRFKEIRDELLAIRQSAN